MNLSVQEQHFEVNGDIYSKTYDPKQRIYRFFLNGKEIDIYQWNQAANRSHPMCDKASHPNLIIRWIERHRWFLTRRNVAVGGSKFILDIIL